MNAKNVASSGANTTINSGSTAPDSSRSRFRRKKSRLPSKTCKPPLQARRESVKRKKRQSVSGQARRSTTPAVRPSSSGSLVGASPPRTMLAPARAAIRRQSRTGRTDGQSSSRHSDHRPSSRRATSVVSSPRSYLLHAGQRRSDLFSLESINEVNKNYNK